MTTFTEFRAGKLNMVGTRVTADPRKGTLRIMQDEDSLVHLQWLDRTSGNVEDDLIIVPGEATFTRVSQCTTGRVYVVKHAQMDTRRFFWMQEPKEEKDNEVVPIVQRVLATGSNATVGAAGGGGRGQANLAAMAGNLGLDQDTLMSIIRASGGMGGLSGMSSAPRPTPAPTPAPAPAASGGGGGAVSAASLQQMIQSLQQTPTPTPGLSLQEVLSADDVIPLLAAHPDIIAAVASHLPEQDRSPQKVSEVLRSPQFAQALGSLTAVLRSGQGGAVIRSLGLPGGQGGAELSADAVRVFLEAIQAQANQNPAASSSGAADTDMPDAS